MLVTAQHILQHANAQSKCARRKDSRQEYQQIFVKVTDTLTLHVALTVRGHKPVCKASIALSRMVLLKSMVLRPKTIRMSSQIEGT